MNGFSSFADKNRHPLRWIPVFGHMQYVRSGTPEQIVRGEYDPFGLILSIHGAGTFLLMFQKTCFLS